MIADNNAIRGVVETRFRRRFYENVSGPLHCRACDLDSRLSISTAPLRVSKFPARVVIHEDETHEISLVIERRTTRERLL